MKNIAVMIVLLFSFIIAAPVFADCSDRYYNCYKGDTREQVGRDFVRMCWSIRNGTCYPCFCDGPYNYCMEGGYETDWCNKSFPACNGNCCVKLDNGISNCGN